MTKTKSEFLAAEEVQEMVSWLRARFRNGFRHSYAERKTHETWTCDGLFEAFRKYRWPKADWLANKSKLDGYRRRVRSAMAKCDDDELFNVCEKVSLIRFRGHHPKGGYDGQNGIRQVGTTSPAAVL